MGFSTSSFRNQGVGHWPPSFKKERGGTKGGRKDKKEWGGKKKQGIRSKLGLEV